MRVFYPLQKYNILEMKKKPHGLAIFWSLLNVRCISEKQKKAKEAGNQWKRLPPPHTITKPLAPIPPPRC